jgi:plastocyanin
VSLKVLAVWGVIIFAAGFFHGRQISKLGSVALTPIPSAVSAAASSTNATSAAPAQTQSGAAQPARVTVRLLKFSPQAIEVGAGEIVQWENSDLTPHTVTSEGGGDLNSGSIDAGASWRHTFTQPGTFAYFCTFHPEMKGSVIVK